MAVRGSSRQFAAVRGRSSTQDVAGLLTSSHGVSRSGWPSFFTVRTVPLPIVAVGVGIFSLIGLPASIVRADGLRGHAAVGLAHAAGQPQQRELGFGGVARVAVELPLGAHFALSTAAGATGLAAGSAPDDPRFAARSFGVGLTFLGAARLTVANLWLEGGGGAALTGGALRPAVEARAGYDVGLSKGRAWTIGPFLGFSHVFQVADALRPEDATVLSLGIEVSAETHPRAELEVVVVPPPPPPPPPPPVLLSDRDSDQIFDADDACPDVPGVRSSDPKANGCPPDRDHDSVRDADDACPDVAGIPTADPSTNGCPATEMRLDGDQVVINDIIHFRFGSHEVSEASKPLVRKIAEYLVARGDVVAIDIEGHADEIGSQAYNINLSRDRGTAVKQLLIEYGVTATLTVRAWGKARPKSRGHNELQLRENRRVELTVSRQRAAPPISPPPGETPRETIPQVPAQRSP